MIIFNIVCVNGQYKSKVLVTATTNHTTLLIRSYKPTNTLEYY